MPCSGTPSYFSSVGACGVNTVPVTCTPRSGERSPLRGVQVTGTVFTPQAPTDEKYDGVPLQGIRLRVTERDLYDPTRLAVALLAAIRAVHSDSFVFRADGFDRLAAGPELRQALVAGQSPWQIWSDWQAPLVRFRR